jgi:hypothetical protein
MLDFVRFDVAMVMTEKYYLLGCDTLTWWKFTDVSEEHAASICRVEE